MLPLVHFGVLRPGPTMDWLHPVTEAWPWSTVDPDAVTCIDCRALLTETPYPSPPS